MVELVRIAGKAATFNQANDDAQTAVKLQKLVLECLQLEANAILAFASNANLDCVRAIELIYQSSGPLVVAGIGKSGHIARKIASTFRSVGKPAIFLHAGEASHGDLGLVQKGSVVLILSNSGETAELFDVIHYCRMHGIPMIGMTANPDSSLAKASEIAIVYGKLTEACQNGLAPTTSTTLCLAIGDALAIGVSSMLGIAPDDFRRYHPGGKLGTKLLKVQDLMRSGEALPFVSADMAMSDVVVVMSEKSLGIAILIEEKLAGIITDGDMRRHAHKLWESKAKDIATLNPVCVSAVHLVSEAIEIMSRNSITTCLVTDKDNVVVGALHLHDCLSSGAVL